LDLTQRLFDPIQKWLPYGRKTPRRKSVSDGGEKEDNIEHHHEKRNSRGGGGTLGFLPEKGGKEKQGKNESLVCFRGDAVAMGKSCLREQVK